MMAQLRPSQTVVGWFGIILLLLLWLVILAQGRLPYALIEQFRPIFTLALLFCTLYCGWQAWRHPLPVFLAVGTIWSAWGWLPLFWGAPVAPQNAPTFSVLHINIDATLATHGAVWAYVKQQSADLLFLQEITPKSAEALAQLTPEYELVAINPLWNTQGSALLRHRHTPIEIVAHQWLALPADSPRKMLLATAKWGETTLQLLSFQVSRPNNPYQAEEYRATLSWVQAREEKNHPLILIGDFNTTPWSYQLRHLLTAGGLHLSQKGYGWQGSWHSADLPLLTLPIDQAIYTTPLLVIDRGVGPMVGGDHRPIHVTFTLAPN